MDEAGRYVVVSDAQGQGEHLEPRSYVPGFVRTLLEVFLAAMIALTLAAGVRGGIMQAYFIPTPSMAPTIQPGDRVLVNKLYYRFDPPHRGDVVVFPDPTHSTPLLIKRVVAVEGDVIDTRSGKLVINGKKVQEGYTAGHPTEPGPARFPLAVPKGCVYLMGDNRTDSHDSRWFGPQPVSALKGRAVALYWPLDHMSDL